MELGQVQHGQVSGEKITSEAEAAHLEDGKASAAMSVNLVYADEDEEPKIHFRTWIAYASMMILIFVQNMSLQAPPSVVSITKNDYFTSPRLTCIYTAFIYCSRPEKLCRCDMGTQLSDTGASLLGPGHLFGIRHLPDPKASPAHCVRRCTCGFWNRSWLRQQLQIDRCSDPDRRWLCPNPYHLQHTK